MEQLRFDDSFTYNIMVAENIEPLKLQFLHDDPTAWLKMQYGMD